MITVFGSINLDLIFPLERMPGPGATQLTRLARAEPGGKGANQAAAAALDGARVCMFGAVGDDGFATPALAGLERAGVALAGVARVAAMTGIAAVMVDGQGQSQIAVSAGANLFARAGQVPDRALGPGCWLMLQMETEPAENAALVARARANGARVILNLAPARPLAPEALAGVDVLVVNEEEAGWLAERLGSGAGAASLAAALGGVTVVRTLGVQGAELADAEGVLRLAPFPVAAADATGAGDCFAGVMAAVLDRGGSLRDAVIRANVAAALCCTRIGAQGALPRAAETDQAMRHRSEAPT